MKCLTCKRNFKYGGSCDTSRSNGTGCFLFVENNKNSIDYGKFFGISRHQKRVETSVKDHQL